MRITSHRVILFLYLLSSFSLCLKAQEVRNVRGTVLSATNGKPLQWCKVYVCDSTGNQIKKTLTLSDGIYLFQITDGRYSLNIFNTGYKSVSQPFSVNGKDTEIPAILMEVGEEIAAASVSEKQLLKFRGDRYIYDVSGDPDASKINMMEMMSRIPLLSMSHKNGTLEYDGQPLSKILVNREDNGLINVRRQYPMEFIRAEYMKQIELVLPGSSEYQNDRPILVIKLAHELPFGFAGSLQASASSKSVCEPSVDLIINTPALGIGLGYSFNHSGLPATTDLKVLEYDDPSSVKVSSRQTSLSQHDSHEFSLSLFRNFAGEKFRVIANLASAQSTGFSKTETTTHHINVNDQIDTELRSLVCGTSESPFRLNGSLSIGGSWGDGTGISRRKKNSWKVEYAYKDLQRCSSEYHFASSTANTANNMQKEHRLIGELEFRNVLPKPLNGSIKAKSGYFNRSYRTNSEYKNILTGMDYRQHVAYVDAILLGSAFDRKIGYNIMLNSEYIYNDGSSYTQTNSTPIGYKEFNINPSAGVSWYHKYGGLGISYSRRVKRPSINQLNPYTDVRDPNNISYGNPGLHGQKIDAITFSTQFHPHAKWIRNINLNFSYSHSKDAITRIIFASQDGVTNSSFYNLGRIDTGSINLSFTLTPHKTITMNFLTSYEIIKSMLPSGDSSMLGSPKASLTLSWHPKWFEMAAHIHAFPTTPSVQRTNLKIEPMGEVSVSKYFEKIHFGMSLSVTDLFHSGGQSENVLQLNGMKQYNYIERIGRTYCLRIYYRFGKFKQLDHINVSAYDID